MSLLELFCCVDDFCQAFAPKWQQRLLGQGLRQRRREPQLCLSERMTIIIHFHQSGYRTFKDYYLRHVSVYLRQAFPTLVSYTRFVELMPQTVVPLMVYLHHCFGQCTGTSFVDATSLAVCRNQRIHQHKVFAGIAARGKSTVGWFYGFKLHLVANDRGELLACQLTPGNVDDRKPVPILAQRLFGKLFGDKGYISQKLVEQLLTDCGVHLVTFARANMHGRLLHQDDAILLRKRAIMETINDQLKNISQIEHSRHRSPLNFVVNLFAGLIAYCLQPKKPSLHLLDHALLAAA
jgi:hypothetical protein